MDTNNTIVVSNVNTKVVCKINTYVLISFTMNLTYGQRLKAAREHKDLSQDKLAELSGVKQGTISKIERGGQQHSGFDAILAYHLDVEAIWLSTGDEQFQPKWLKNEINDHKVKYFSDDTEIKAWKVPILNWIQAGKFTEIIDQPISDEPDSWTSTTIRPRENTFALRIKGDSMEPLFTENMIIIVEPDFEAKPGDFVVVRNGEEANFKQLIKDGNDFYLKPLNSRYPIKPLNDSQIVGVVRESVHKFR